MYTGWYRGFVLGMLDLVRWVGSLLLGLRYYPYLAEILFRNVEGKEIWIPPVSFLLVTLFASFLIHFLGSMLLKALPPTLHAHGSNRALGLIPGFLSGGIAAAIISALLLAVPLPEPIEANVQQSRLINRIAGFTDRLETELAMVFYQPVHRTLNRLTIDPDSREFVELPFRVENPIPRPELEMEMLELINQERAEHGLQPLVADTALRRVARMHAADMFRRGYFSHLTPEGHDPFQRIREANIPFRNAGENLALAPTLPVAHEGLMNSPGHRANILQRRFGRVGIGIMEGGRRRLIVTQNFRN
jgi:uncharacterized protein YkwD/uncharacterized membrane protein required for colicin V production